MDIRYRALQIIEVGGVRAYNIGDQVPAENVALHEYVLGEQVEEFEPPAEEEPPVSDDDTAQEPAPAPETPASAKTKTSRTQPGS